MVHVEPAGGDPLRVWSVSGSVGRDGDADGALFRFVRGGQRSVVCSGQELDGLIAGADIVIGIDGDRVESINPSAVSVTVTAFGPAGAGDVPDFLLQAACGALSAHGDEAGDPLQISEGGGRLAQWIGGTFAAAAALLLLAGQRAGGAGNHADVSLVQAMALTAVTYPTVFAVFPGGTSGTVRWQTVPGIEPCADGYVGFSLITGQQWLDFLAMIGHEELTDQADLYTFAGRMARRDEIAGMVRGWTADRTVAEITELAALYRLPAAPIGNGASIPQMQQIIERHALVANPRGAFLQPRSPLRLASSPAPEPRPSPGLGEHNGTVRWEPRRRPPAGRRPPRHPLAGIRVLDLTCFWSGPMATQLMASFGADVIKVESVQHPDGQRFSSRVSPSEPDWYEQSAPFVAANLGKRGITLDLTSAEGMRLFQRLIAGADLLVENFTPRVLDGFGLSFGRVQRINRRLIVVRMPAFGLSGPWRDRPGYAQTIAQAGGLAWTTGHRDGMPLIPGALCDPVSGIHGLVAALAALEQRRRSGAGQLVEVPMIDAILNIAAEQIVEHSAYGQLVGRGGNGGPFGAPQGVFRCADGEWLALSVRDDREWEQLVDALGCPPWARDPSLSREAGRRARANDVEERLAAQLRETSLAEALATMRSAGLSPEPVVAAHLLEEEPRVSQGGFFEEVDHPVIGSRRYPGWPFLLREGPERWFPRPAPLLGQHTGEILGELGLDPEQIAALADRRVIGSTLLQR